MRTLVIWILFFKVVGIHSQMYTLKQMNLKGAVKSVEEIYIKKLPDEENDTIFEITSYFDKQGKVILTKNIFFTAEYHTQSTYTYENQTLNKVVTRLIDTLNSDSHNKIIEYLTVTYPKKNKVVILRFNEFDEKQAVREFYYKDNRTQQRKDRFYNDEELIDTITFNYTYDKNGDVIEITEDEQKDSLKTHYIDYDSKNNWTNAKTTETFADYYYISKRKITYY